MISEREIYQSANVMMKQYGEDAALEAAQRADAMLEKGDMEGCRVWKRILVNEIVPRSPSGSLYTQLITNQGPYYKLGHFFGHTKKISNILNL